MIGNPFEANVSTTALHALGFDETLLSSILTMADMDLRMLVATLFLGSHDHNWAVARAT